MLQAGRSISYTFTQEAPCGWTELRGRIDRSMLQTVVSDFRDTQRRIRLTGFEEVFTVQCSIVTCHLWWRFAQLFI
jgi:hypothetical protein